MQGELFTYLGLSQLTHFFLHTEFTAGHNISDMCGQVYNTMIHETMIQENQKVVVFNIMQNGEVIVVCVDHALFVPMKYTSESLEVMFRRLMAISRSDVMTIAYDGVKYFMYESVPVKLEGKELPEKIAISDIQHVISTKPIPYLQLS
jgi:hypothetical protein